MDSTSESPSTPDLSVEPNEIRSSGKGRNVKKKNDLRFPQKTLYILNESSEKSPDVACWNEDGDAFIIKNKSEFEETYLTISFESFVRQLHLYGFKKMNNRKNAAGSGRKKELIFHHDDFLRGREDLIVCMQTVKKGTKDKMKKKKDLDESALEDVESSGNVVDEEESGIEMKVDRLDSKMDGMHLKLDELTRQIQTSLTVLLAASSNIPDYQPIPLNEKYEVHHTAKRKRWDDEEAKMPSRIQLQSVNNGASQLTLDTDEMNVIQTLMDCDDDNDDDEKVGNFDTTVENHQTAQEPKVHVHTLVNAEVVDEPVDHVYIPQTKESKKKWYTKKKYIIGITVIIILIIFTGVLVGQLIKTGNDSNESVQNPPRNDPKPPRAPDDPNQ